MSGMLAKVINSTVGTNHFKSLDEVLSSAKSIVASDEVYQKFGSEFIGVRHTYSSTNKEKDVCTFTLPLDGSVKLNFNLSFTSDSTSADPVLKIYRNGVIYGTYTYDGDLASDQSDAYSETLHGNRGDVFKIALSATGESKTSSLTLKTLSATVVDSKTMNITSLL